ncbi:MULTISPECIES: hypothetical protein [unclassified Acinetobacter]|uniref:hypothetical protein n=1 Tax=unclassified Acinetobacter TaxID=196816 RepID=UPI001F4A8145|nr:MULTISPECIES: hypothetical protein [unclassified Acinetobacter]MCH7353291.1 hypothetical protein [Acinetobacter sp. NIPH 2023]MCH7360673.1 hypothetical protein [Acinetobacter sp. NIPH 2024]
MKGEVMRSEFFKQQFNSLLDAFNGGYNCRQTEVDELQNRNKMLSNNVAEQGKKLVYQNEIIETQACKLLGLREEKDELQKRVDAIKQLIQVYKDEEKELELKEWEQSTIYGRVAIDLEQALKGGES